jgi:hypothetical protein
LPLIRITALLTKVYACKEIYSPANENRENFAGITRLSAIEQDLLKFTYVRITI